MARIVLSGSVGKRCDNDPIDVAVVRSRLHSLGFNWVSGTGAGDQPEFVETIELFQAICKGKTELKRGGGVDGKISRQGFTHKWLAAQNAPGWVKIYGLHGKGWSTTVHKLIRPTGDPYIESNGGYGTTWIFDMVKTAAFVYSSSWQPNFPLMWVRDCAKKKGGNAKYHKSHETGLDIDFRLPLRPVAGLLPDATWIFLGTKALRKKHLYREAVESQLTALVAQPLVSVIGYVDDTAPSGHTKLHNKFGKVHTWKGHKNHMHVRIQPPSMIPGQIE